MAGVHRRWNAASLGTERPGDPVCGIGRAVDGCADPCGPGGIDAGTPVALFPTHLATGSNIVAAGYNSCVQYAVAPDGRFLMNVNADDAVTSPITIVLNWTAGLQR